MKDLILYCEEKSYKDQKYLAYYVIVNGIKIGVRIGDNTGKNIVDKYYTEEKLVK